MAPKNSRILVILWILDRGLRRIKSANQSISLLVLSFFVKKCFISNFKEAVEMQRKACAPQK